VSGLYELFSWFCGQTHCWAPGGRLMPVCERCMGLYVGVFAAAVLILLLRPRITNSLLWINGLMMLSMIPFGYHLVPHGALVRTATGFFFGVGLFFYSLLIPGQLLSIDLRPHRVHSFVYACATAAPLPILMFAAAKGPLWSGVALSILSIVGLIIIGAMLLLNFFLLLRAFTCRAHPQAVAGQ
jgi:uncharacterized membrane protein